MLKFLCFLVFVLSFVHSAYAVDIEDAKAACASNREVPVHITPRFDEPAYDYTASIADITRMAADTHHSIHEALTLGLTRYEPILGISAPLVSMQLPDGTTCAYVDHVDVTVGYQNVIVYVASEIPQDSCGFGEVMGHEQKHINVNQQILQEYAPRISDGLGVYLQTNAVFIEQDPQDALNLLREKMQETLKTIMDEMSADNVARQAAVDSVEEYQRVSNSCGGQLRGIVAQFMRVRR